MSKVLKKSSGFIAEEIFPKDVEQPPVWGDITIKIDPEQELAERKIASSQEIKKEESVDQTFDNDFSAPESSAHDLGEMYHPSDESTPLPPQEVLYNQEEMDNLAEEYYNRGVQAGMERIESDYGLSIKTLQLASEQLNSIRETILKNSMEEMQELVMLISEKIIRSSIANQKDTIIQTVGDAIQQAVKSDEFILSVNPDDYETIKAKSSDFINSISGLENIIVRPEPSIEPGGCQIESSNCTVDATVASQLQIIEDSLKE